MKKIIALVVCLSVLVLAGCGVFVSENDVVSAIEKQGYSDFRFKASTFSSSIGEVAVVMTMLVLRRPQ